MGPSNISSGAGIVCQSSDSTKKFGTPHFPGYLIHQWTFGFEMFMTSARVEHGGDRVFHSGLAMPESAPAGSEERAPGCRGLGRST